MKDTLKFDFETGEFVIKNGNPVVLTGKDALVMWIEKLLKTQLNRYKPYLNTRYGVNVGDLIIGNTYNIDFTESELKRELELALLQHKDINSVTSFSVERKGAVLNVTMKLDTAYGEITERYDTDN